MYSPTRKKDKEDLIEIGEEMIALTKTGTPEAMDLFEKYATIYENLERKIETYDYSKEDEHYWWVEKLFKPIRK